MDQTKRDIIDPKRIDVLDGIRALSIIIVMIFHFWQQTWIFPTVKTPFLAFIGLEKIDFTAFAKVGYLFVDMMVLISGFLLFLPVMRQIFMGADMIKWKDYARKRLARIVPSYYFCILLIFFAHCLPSHVYSSTQDAVKDLVTHLTFTQTLYVKTYLGTQLNAVLWTVAIEVWFYILFPLFAELIRRRRSDDNKKSVVASVICIFLLAALFYGIARWWRLNVVEAPGAYVAMKINQLPAFMGVYANGMLGALIYVLLAKHTERNLGLTVTCTVVSLVCIALITGMVKECAALSAQAAQLWQVSERLRLTGVFMLFILSTALAAKWYRFLFSNKLMVFLSGISYNLYIWHQWLAVHIKNVWRIPYWEGSVPPNQLWDHPWMNKYAAIITVAAFAAAILATYLIEKPFANLILGRPMFGKKKKER
ncbi:MAG: acyltransferase [Clostridia bacterium]|nr:acyltransferase [Clostridia bacterium]